MKLSPAQLAVLKRYALPPEKRLGQLNGTASRTIDALVRKGLLVRTENPDYPGYYRPEITDAGRAALTDDGKVWRPWDVQ